MPPRVGAGGRRWPRPVRRAAVIARPPPRGRPRGRPRTPARRRASRAAPARKRSSSNHGCAKASTQLVGGVGGVLVLDLVVPGPEGQRQVGALARLERLEPGDELLPEAGRRPVLDGVAGAFGGRRRPPSRRPRAARRRRTGWRRCRGGACRGRRSRGRAAWRSAAATRSGRRRSGTGRRRPCPRWRRARGRCRPRGAARAAGVEHHAELVEEDLLAGAVGVEVGGVDHLAQLGLDEEVAEHRELHGEVADLATAWPRPLANQRGVAVVDDHRVAGDEVVDPGSEGVDAGLGRSSAMLHPPATRRLARFSQGRSAHDPGQATDAIAAHPAQSTAPIC